MTSEHEDFAYNSLKVSERLLLSAGTYCMAPAAQTNGVNVIINPKPAVISSVREGSWKAAAFHQLLGLGLLTDVSLWGNICSLLIYLSLRNPWR